MKWQGNPALMAGDKVQITDVDNNTYNTLIMEQQLRYTGGLSATATAKGKTETAQEFSSSGTLTQKLERYAIEQANIKVVLAEKANISDLTAIYADIDNLYANKANIVDLNATIARVQNLEVTSATITQLQSVQAQVDNLSANKADVTELTTAVGRIDTLESNVADIDTILSKAVFAELAEVGQIVAGSSIIAEGAIGSAQISDLSASKLTSGIIDAAVVTIQGTEGRLRIKNNLLQVFDGTTELFERVALGDLDGDGSVYGLRIRGADGQTILLDHNGLTDAGFTDGYNKLENGSLNPIKLDIAQVVTLINEGTTTINSSKILVTDKTLDVVLSTLETTVNDQGETISSQQAQITALNNAVQLKVDVQTYTTDINNINSQLSTQSSAISILQDEIVTKVTQTDIDNAVGPLETRISSAESSITQHAQEIALKVSKDGVISAINQTPETIKIQASKINLVGAVTVLSDISGNLGNITAGTITGVTFKTAASGNRLEISGNVITGYESDIQRLIVDYDSLEFINGYGGAAGSITSGGTDALHPILKIATPVRTDADIYNRMVLESRDITLRAVSEDGIVEAVFSSWGFTLGDFFEVLRDPLLNDVMINILGSQIYYIVESGENANGRYVRFSDGTQVCWNSNVTLTYLNANNLRYIWTYPAPFLNRPSVAGNQDIPPGGSKRTDIYPYISAYTANANISIYSYTGAFVDGDTALAYPIAIGRWK